MYSIDTNIYLDWWVRRYPEDVFPIVRTGIEGMVAKGHWNAVQGVADEIDHVGTSQLQAWAKTTRGNSTNTTPRLSPRPTPFQKGSQG